MPIDARLKRMLQNGTISDWLLRDPDAIDEIPTDPVSDKAVRAALGTVTDDATLNTVIGMLHKVVNRLAETLSITGTVAFDDPGLAKENTLAQALTKLQDIFNAVDGLEVTAGNIEINSSAINLQTDEVEALLRIIRDRLPAVLDVTDGGLIVHVQNPTNNPETGLAKDITALDIKRGVTDYETRLDYDENDILVYVGKAPNGTSISANNWVIQKLTWTGSNLTRVQVRTGSWETRNGLPW